MTKLMNRRFYQQILCSLAGSQLGLRRLPAQSLVLLGSLEPGAFWCPQVGFWEPQPNPGSGKSSFSSAVSFPPSFSFDHLWVSRGCTNSLTALLMCVRTLFPTISPPSHILQPAYCVFCSFLLPSGKLGSWMLKRAFLPPQAPALRLAVLCAASSLRRQAGASRALPLLLKDSARPKLLWLSASLPRPCPSAATEIRC